MHKKYCSFLKKKLQITNKIHCLVELDIKSIPFFLKGKFSAQQNCFWSLMITYQFLLMTFKEHIVPLLLSVKYLGT